VRPVTEPRRNLLLPDVERWPIDRPVIELENVTKAFNGKRVIDGLSLRIRTGITTVIVGESGSGKSTLLRLMNGLLLPDSGTVRLFGQDLARIDERQRTELRKRVTMVFQSYALIDSLTVAENVAFPLAENTRMKRGDIAGLVDDLLNMLGLLEARDRLPAELSGGMRKRVSLARAVISNPEVVLFDEPTTGLDPVMIQFVDDLIIRTRQEFQITSVIISHDMASNRRLADHMAFLAEGRIVAEGSFDEVTRADLPEVKRFMSQAETARMHREEPAAEEPAAPKVPRVSPTLADVEPVVQVDGLYKSFGKNAVLKGIDLDIPRRKITVIIGGSGSGKSVLVKHIIGLLRPDKGTVRVFGESLAELDDRGLQRVQERIGMLFQGAALFDSMTVGDNIAFPLVERRKLKRSEIRDRVQDIARRLKVPDILDRFPADISVGQRKRVGLARAIITEPEIMIYDEPTTGQDPVMMKRVDEMIVEANAEFQITSVVISHDMSSTFRIADQIAMIYKGDLIAVGTPAELRALPDPRVREFIYAGSEA
jgi:ABC-type transporter Mla maintaining outer membrane lipid asymmetry ATPase subunit MlaF